jgi:hypothetical protein
LIPEKQGNSRLLLAYISKNWMASGKNQSGLKTLLNCMILFRLKRLFWQNTFIKQYFLSAWTPLPLKRDIAKDGLKIRGLYRAYFGKPGKI